MAPSLRKEDSLAAILSSSQDGLFVLGLDGTILMWSNGAERLYGYAEAEITCQPLERLIPSSEITTYHKLLTSLSEDAPAGVGFCERRHKSGATIRVSLTHTAVRDERGGIVAVVESGKRASSKQTTTDDLPVRSLLGQMPAFLWTTDSNLRITSNWGSGMELAKVKPGALIGRTAQDFLRCLDIDAADLSRHATVLQGTSSRFEFRLRDRDFEIRLEPLRDAQGQVVGCVGAGIDSTERKRGEEEARYQAPHDALTGLANYREFLEALEREVRRAERANRSFALLLLDLDDLKRINDRWGHLTGNRALRRLAEVMKEQCRSTDLAARYGGDKFAVLLIDADPATARQISLRVENTLDKDREEPRLRVSIGSSVYPDDGRSARELLEAADQQLYKRKKGAHGQIVSAR